jgi:hypothetical protein
MLHNEESFIKPEIETVQYDSYMNKLLNITSDNSGTGLDYDMFFETDKYNTDKYNTDKYNTDKYNTDKYNTDKYNTDEYNTDKYNSDKYNPDKYNTDKYNTDKYNTDKYNTDKYNTDEYDETIDQKLYKGCNFYSSEEEDTVLWTSYNIEELKIIMNTINKSGLMKPLGYIIGKYLKMYPNLEEYNILLVDEYNKDIDRSVLVLASACETLVRNSMLTESIIMNRFMIYEALGSIIYSVINSVFKYPNWETNYQEEYMVNTLCDIFYYKSNDILYRNIITNCYMLTKQIINIEKYYNNSILPLLNTSMTHAEQLNINQLLSREDIRNFKTILGNHRTIYLKLFLILVNALCHDKSNINSKLLIKKTTITDYNQFVAMLGDPLIELLIVVTGCMIMTSVPFDITGSNSFEL